MKINNRSVPQSSCKATWAERLENTVSISLLKSHVLFRQQGHQPPSCLGPILKRRLGVRKVPSEARLLVAARKVLQQIADRRRQLPALERGPTLAQLIEKRDRGILASQGDPALS